MRIRGMFSAAALLFIAAQPAEAQQRDWSGWHGCWQGIGLDVPVGEMLCILPGENAATVRLATVSNNTIVSEAQLRADGVARAVEEGGCKGTERATFSADGRRIYTASEMDCGPGTIKRTSTGIIAMVNESEWIDAQAVTVEGQHAARTTRFQSVPVSRLDESIAALLPAEQRLAQETARLHAAAPLTQEHVIEATRVAAAPVVEAVLAARQQGFKLDVESLRGLKSAGVPPSTIDVMVALSYPQEFAVEEQSAAAAQHVMPESRSYRDDCYYDPFFGVRSGCGYGYDRYGYSRYGYSPYSSYGYYGGFYNRPPVVVVVTPTSEIQGGGSVVKGRGYTRSKTSTTPTSTTSSSRPSTSSAGSSSGTSTSGGSSSSGTSSTPVRTAKPRGGGL